MYFDVVSTDDLLECYFWEMFFLVISMNVLLSLVHGTKGYGIHFCVCVAAVQPSVLVDAVQLWHK